MKYLFIILIALLTASCSKEYSCACHIVITSGVESTGRSATINFKSTSRKKAMEACNSYYEEFDGPGYSADFFCRLK